MQVTIIIVFLSVIADGRFSLVQPYQHLLWLGHLLQLSKPQVLKPFNLAQVYSITYP